MAITLLLLLVAVSVVDGEDGRWSSEELVVFLGGDEDDVRLVD